MIVEPGDVRLIEAHGVAPRPNLAAVGVALEREVDAVLARVDHRLGLVRHQDDGARLVAAGERASHVLSVAVPKTVGARVIDAGEVEPVPQGDAFVA